MSGTSSPPSSSPGPVLSAIGGALIGLGCVMHYVGGWCEGFMQRPSTQPKPDLEKYRIWFCVVGAGAVITGASIISA